MLQIQYIKENKANTIAGLNKKHFKNAETEVEKVLQIDENRRQTQVELDNILSQANIGLLASTSEGFPITILEYAQAKLPVLSSNVGFCSSLIQNGKTGFTFEPMDEKNFIDSLLNFISDPNLQSICANNLYEICNNHYSENIVISKLITLYTNLS